LEDWEQAAILAFHDQFPLEGYRRLAYMMLDADVEVEKARLSHALIVRIVEEAVQQIEHGSFYQVLEDFKGRGKDGLVEEVNQVRRYRNWVAHGRRTAMPDAVDPDTAYRRLKRFLDVLGMASDRVS
jgi:hypothetical protein